MARLTAAKRRDYNVPMAKQRKTARLAARVSEETKAKAERIAEVMQWSLTEVYEKSIEALASRKDVREALAKASGTADQ